MPLQLHFPPLPFIWSFFYFHLSHSSHLLLWIFSHPPLCGSSYSSVCISSSSLETYGILDVCGLFVLHKQTRHVFFLLLFIYDIIQGLLCNVTANLSQCSCQREEKCSFPADSLTSAPYFTQRCVHRQEDRQCGPVGGDVPEGQWSRGPTEHWR